MTPSEATAHQPLAADGKPPLTVLIAGDTFTPDVNGAAKFSEHLASGMRGRGHRVHVAAPAASRRHGRWVEEFDGQRIMMHRVRSFRWYPHDWLRYVWPWSARKKAREILDVVQPDVVHFQSAVVLGRAMAREAHARGIRVIGTNHLMMENMVEHSLLPKPLQDVAAELWWKDARETFAMASALTTPTRRAADFLEKNARVEHVLAISCGLRVSDYTPDFSPKAEQRMLFVGRVTGEKHIDVLLRAVQRLQQAGRTRIRLDIVGGGDQKSNLEKLARQLGIEGLTTFHGYVDDADLKRLFTRSTVFAMPSTAELQSIATMEAMSSGLPVVAADAMALPHLVHTGENGYLFTPGDDADLADKLGRVLDAPAEEHERMARRGLEMVAAHDIDATLALFERLYRGEPVDQVAPDSINEQDHSLDGR